MEIHDISLLKLVSDQQDGNTKEGQGLIFGYCLSFVIYLHGSPWQ